MAFGLLKIEIWSNIVNEYVLQQLFHFIWNEYVFVFLSIQRNYVIMVWIYLHEVTYIGF